MQNKLYQTEEDYLYELEFNSFFEKYNLSKHQQKEILQLIKKSIKVLKEEQLALRIYKSYLSSKYRYQKLRHQYKVERQILPIFQQNPTSKSILLTFTLSPKYLTSFAIENNKINFLREVSRIINKHFRKENENGDLFFRVYPDIGESIDSLNLHFHAILLVKNINENQLEEKITEILNEWKSCYGMVSRSIKPLNQLKSPFRYFFNNLNKPTDHWVKLIWLKNKGFYSRFYSGTQENNFFSKNGINADKQLSEVYSRERHLSPEEHLSNTHRFPFYRLFYFVKASIYPDLDTSRINQRYGEFQLSILNAIPTSEQGVIRAPP